MKILIIGGGGMLGQDLVRVLQECRHAVLSPSRAELDITNPESVRSYIMREQPQCVLLSAAYTRVDDCESHTDLAWSVNADGPRNVALACRSVGARLIYVSTDYVFNGRKTTPYTEDDLPDPTSVYGQTKLAGEMHIKEILRDYLSVRTSWLYGLHGRNFVATILKKAQTEKELRVVNDQKGSPTYTGDLAEGLATLVGIKDAKGIVNVTNTQSCTWFEFAETILRLKNVGDVTVYPVTSEQFKVPAKRPANSILASDRYLRLTGKTLRPWKEALVDYLALRG
jgi:dTDP-4-dehydrorhamnose reductase